jgi:hypothetical protein
MVGFEVRSMAWASVVILGSVSAFAAPAKEGGLWLSSLSSSFATIDMAGGDLDGDGRDELALCYREELHDGVQKGGVAVFADATGATKPMFHVQLSDAPCEKIAIRDKKLVLMLAGNRQLVWGYGNEVRYRTDAGSALAAVQPKASTQSDAAHNGRAAYDGDVSTSWGEGVAGTGIGQTLTIRLPKAMSIGAVGVVCGDASGSRAFFDHNRVHRGSIQAKTAEDEGDTSAGVDFASLGIATIGDRSEFTCENRIGITYVPINRRDVVEIELRIDSVYLGDKKDEARVAEIELIPLLSQSETLDRAKDAGRPVAKPVVSTPVIPTNDPRGEEAVKRLDQSAGALVPIE